LSCVSSSFFAESWDQQREAGLALVPLAAAIGLMYVTDGDAFTFLKR
jgi:hypothetical protein